MESGDCPKLEVRDKSATGRKTKHQKAKDERDFPSPNLEAEPRLCFLCSLYPVVPTNSRIITEKEIEINGFLFPKNVSEARVPVCLGTPAALADGHTAIFPL